MPQFFIDRPVFAWVLAILIAIAGLIALTRLSAEAYPEIAPPQIAVTTTFPGASAATVESTVTQVIEQQLTGLDNLLYFTSQSASDGTAAITLTFQNGTNPDIAAVQTQNRIALAAPRLPAEVNQQGIRIAKVSAGFLGGIALRSAPGGPSAEELGNLLASRVLDPIQRVPGVGSVLQFTSEYAMRVWLDADRLRAYGLSAAGVLAAVRAQNAQFASGTLGGQPSGADQSLTATVAAEGRFTTPEQFENVLLRTEPNGASVRLRDVARVTLGAAQYGFEVRVGTTPVGAFAIQLAPGANALQVAGAVEAKMRELQASFPAGVSWFWGFTSIPFIRVAIHEVLITLCEAVALVFLVMLVFLQSFRATLIPTLVVPSALLGTLVGMYTVG
ncbi:MAG: multidrug efflux RND transporter permease subunit, partial [Gammaproteobacteria bacterium]